MSTDKIYQYYGSGSMSGYRANDTVALNLNSTPVTEVSEFNFFACDSQIGISETFDGILGMSR
jgi:hypothetical protein